MDTSKEFIKQCEKAEEIQKLRKLNPIEQCQVGDFFKEKTERGEVIVFESNDIKPETAYDDVKWVERKLIWLPRQDQLQEMVINNTLPNPIAGLIWDFSSFTDPSEDIHKICVSMEQLWLAFVMKEKYHKIWNGEDWVEEKE